ncbi:hypothetical protein JCM21900_001245 [Sporobolomyces salmonicolor]
MPLMVRHLLRDQLNAAIAFCKTVELTIALKAAIRKAEQARVIQASAARSADLLVKRFPSDVCFNFPRTSQELWSNEDNLRKLSPDYNSLLSSDFAEGSTSSQAVPLSSGPVEYTYDDSDIETDGLEYQNKAFAGRPFKTVTIVDTAYTTYFAFLVWSATGYVRFAPLHSTFRLKGTDVTQARAAEIETMFHYSESQLPPSRFSQIHLSLRTLTRDP